MLSVLPSCIPYASAGPELVFNSPRPHLCQKGFGGSKHHQLHSSQSRKGLIHFRNRKPPPKQTTSHEVLECQFPCVPRCGCHGVGHCRPPPTRRSLCLHRPRIPTPRSVSTEWIRVPDVLLQWSGLVERVQLQRCVYHASERME